jgi:hypothetical protein
MDTNYSLNFLLTGEGVLIGELPSMITANKDLTNRMMLEEGR